MTWEPGLGKMDRYARHEFGRNKKSYGVKAEVSWQLGTS